MKRIRIGRKIGITFFLVLLAALVVGPVLAGNFATIEIDTLPGEIHAGETVNLSFMVYQHGKTPVHTLTGWDPNGPTPVEPVISGTNSKTGETIEFTAVPDKSEVGRFQAEITFPSAGEWTWEIAPNPLVGTTELAALTILPEVKAPVLETANTAETVAVTTTSAPPEPTGWTALLPWAGGLLLLTGIAMMGFFISRRNRQASVLVDAGD